VAVLLSTGLRREELVRLDREQGERPGSDDRHPKARSEPRGRFEHGTRHAGGRLEQRRRELRSRAIGGE